MLKLCPSVFYLFVQFVLGLEVFFLSFKKSQEVENLYRQGVEELEKISGLKIEKYGKEMISSALDIKDEEWQEVIKSDIKRFKVSDFDIEISNLNISDYNDLLDKKDFIRDKMFKAMLEDGCDAFILMLTDITNNGA